MQPGVTQQAFDDTGWARSPDSPGGSEVPWGSTAPIPHTGSQGSLAPGLEAAKQGLVAGMREGGWTADIPGTKHGQVVAGGAGESQSCSPVQVGEEGLPGRAGQACGDQVGQGRCCGADPGLGGLGGWAAPSHSCEGPCGAQELGLWSTWGNWGGPDLQGTLRPSPASPAFSYPETKFTWNPRASRVTELDPPWAFGKAPGLDGEPASPGPPGDAVT